MDQLAKTRPIIVGGGIAGLMAALEMAPQPVLVISSHSLGTMCSSSLAQGGLAAAIDPDDTPALHAEDTIKAGAGLCDAEAVAAITSDAQRVIERLISLGVAFDRGEAGALELSLEGAHSRRRVVHAKGDSTGLMIMRGLIKAALATPSIEFLSAMAIRVVVENGSARGLVARKGLMEIFLPSSAVALATGGAGGLWRWTTNPLSSCGTGVALAARAGATLADLEFMQFHPTAIDVGAESLPLASEALRGEGALLVNDLGDRFMEGYSRKELEPRDVVTRAIWRQQRAGRKTFLDARQALGASFAKRFPSVYGLCAEHGIDPSNGLIPICPAAHYHMGGVVTDLHGRTDIEGLWACGEVACTGLHGANRLASNSLLEAAVMGTRVGQDIMGRPLRDPGSVAAEAKRWSGLRAGWTERSHARKIRDWMQKLVGIERDRDGLLEALRALHSIRKRRDSSMALVGHMIAAAALLREESRGAHYRADFPEASMQRCRSQKFRLHDLEKILQSCGIVN